MSVAIFVCHRSRVSPFWLTSSRHVAVLVCRRFDCAPSRRCVYDITNGVHFPRHVDNQTANQPASATQLARRQLT